MIPFPLRAAASGVLAAAAPVAAAPRDVAEASLQTRHYAADDSDFANPERGFSRANQGGEGTRAAGLSLVHLYVRLDRFKAAPLPEATLRDIQARFDAARTAGVKLIPRFTYNFPAGLPLRPGDEDAPLATVLRHIGQLKPLLRRNADVTAFVEAGFVGAWGEWHHSTEGLESQAAKAAIVRALLDALPPERAIALRYPRDKIALFGSAPLQSRDRATPRGRVGHHNDCFLASREDWGTYRPDDPESLERQKAYLAAESRFVPIGGETCNAGPDAQPFIPCANALPQLQRLGWSQLNADYHPDVLRLWREQGCAAEISKRLGYRFRLVSAAAPRRAAVGGPLRMTLLIANDGFAPPYNPRGLILVLRNRQSGVETGIALPHDPRDWRAGETSTLTVAATLPRTLAPGQYDLLLHLPDPVPRLRTRPDYAIRLANHDVWEAATGYNRLQLSLDVARPR
ncbi:DUF4832 domain-containing protein [Sphingosinicella sp. BN140058]|uniref:DUF4832 domain-containing protein n=1 Tax=Sphingosinicella sp. BN140058 TaxID=1892855 RepID=UPI001012A71D|nr:DUF4832 domain-containing protein [Sphingosinicella sp. BN140058]QAY75103.1 DUF4832 domain-containing protein [Sphingosinicella sp. BN140058]